MRSLCASTLVLLLLGLQGCGGGGEGATTSPYTAKQQAPAKAKAESGAQTQNKERHKSSREPAQPPAAPSRHAPIAEPVPGTKVVAPGVPTTKGGDNSIQGFGAEGQRDEATQALRAFEEFMRARLAGDWQAACEVASAQFREQLGKITEHTKPEKEGVQIPEGCAATLKLISGGSPAAPLRPIAKVKRELSFRVRGDDYAYLIYEDGEGAVRFIAMARENGVWRVNTLEPTAFREAGDKGSPQ
jgi:hypothetical protein